MVYCVGLTGNLASGKSTAAEIFHQFGLDVIDADKISKDLTAQNHLAYHKIVAHFGPGVLLENGDLNRRSLREIIFSNHEEKKWLENLLHPLIRQLIKQNIALCKSPYCIIEIPLLVRKKMYPYLNKILLIRAPLDIQVTRVMERDHCTRDQALSILAAQPDMNLRLKIADDVIDNDSGHDTLQSRIKNLHYKYLQEANSQHHLD